MDESFLSRDLMDSYYSYRDSNRNLMSAIEILENAQKNNQKSKVDKPIKEEGFFDKLFKPFKCGNNDN